MSSKAIHITFLKFNVERIVFIVLVRPKVNQAIISVQRMNRLHFAIAKLEIKKVEILFDAMFLCTFWNDNCAVLDLEYLMIINFFPSNIPLIINIPNNVRRFELVFFHISVPFPKSLDLR